MTDRIDDLLSRVTSLGDSSTPSMVKESQWPSILALRFATSCNHRNSAEIILKAYPTFYDYDSLPNM